MKFSDRVHGVILQQPRVQTQSSIVGVPKVRMKHKETGNSSQLGGNRQAPFAYWSGFSVCLFVVLLAVFIWALHYRLAQYESTQQAGGHVPAAKMCLTERNRMVAPSRQSRDSSHGSLGSMIFWVVFAFATVVLGLGKFGSSLLVRDSQQRFRFKRSRSCLTHFFFLPPPVVFAAL